MFHGVYNVHNQIFNHCNIHQELIRLTILLRLEINVRFSVDFGIMSVNMFSGSLYQNINGFFRHIHIRQPPSYSYCYHIRMSVLFQIIEDPYLLLINSIFIAGDYSPDTSVYL